MSYIACMMSDHQRGSCIFHFNWFFVMDWVTENWISF